jgi:alkylation response protein AidB-like acyl-CoA dehydrogenase
MGVLFPDEYGGAGMGYVEYATIIEELSRVDGSVGISIAAHNSLCSNHIYKYGTEEQLKKYLTPLASGQHLGAWGLTEPSAGSDASGTKSTAVRTDGGWIVNGSKNFITHAIHAETCVAMAVTDKEQTKQRNLGVHLREGNERFFAVEERRTNSGCARRKRRASCSKTASCLTRKCWAKKVRVCERDGGARRRTHLDRRAGRSVSRRARLNRRCAIRRSGSSFGKPISEFQAIQFKLANMATQIDCRAIADVPSAWMKDSGKKTTKESSMAKLFASEISVAVCEEAIQVHGGYGYTKDYPPEKYWRDSKLCTMAKAPPRFND